MGTWDWSTQLDLLEVKRNVCKLLNQILRPASHHLGNLKCLDIGKKFWISDQIAQTKWIAKWPSMLFSNTLCSAFIPSNGTRGNYMNRSESGDRALWAAANCRNIWFNCQSGNSSGGIVCSTEFLKCPSVSAVRCFIHRNESSSSQRLFLRKQRDQQRTYDTRKAKVFSCDDTLTIFNCN